jgi:hypothetical protein
MPAVSTTLKYTGAMTDRHRDLDLIGRIVGGDQAALRDLYTIYRLVGAGNDQHPNARPTQPGLEDGYVWLMKRAGQAVDLSI